MIPALMMLRHLAAALREEDFARVLSAGLLLIVVGTLSYSLGGGWSVVDGLYVAVATLTTSSILRSGADDHRFLAQGLHRGVCARGHRDPGRGRSPTRHGVHRGESGAGRGQGSREDRATGSYRARRPSLSVRGPAFRVSPYAVATIHPGERPPPATASGPTTRSRHDAIRGPAPGAAGPYEGSARPQVRIRTPRRTSGRLRSRTLTVYGLDRSRTSLSSVSARKVTR